MLSPLCPAQLPEHTWGVDTKVHPGEWDSWSNAGGLSKPSVLQLRDSVMAPPMPQPQTLPRNKPRPKSHRIPRSPVADLQARLQDKSPDNRFAVAVNSWVRQRAYSLWAVQELGERRRGCRSGWAGAAFDRGGCLGDASAACKPLAAILKSPLRHPLRPGPCAGSSAEGVRAWEALAALQDGKAPPNPGAANSSFKRSSLQEPLLFDSEAWQVELSNLTGAIVGLRFKGSGRGSSAAGAPSAWHRLASWLRLPGAWLRAAALDGSGRQQGDSGGWAGFSAPLALPVYSTYSEEDYDVIWSQYSYVGPNVADWFYKDFGKPNATGGCGFGPRGRWGCTCARRREAAGRHQVNPHAESRTQMASAHPDVCLPLLFWCSQGRRAAGGVPAPGRGGVVEAHRGRRPAGKPLCWAWGPQGSGARGGVEGSRPLRPPACAAWVAACFCTVRHAGSSLHEASPYFPPFLSSLPVLLFPRQMAVKMTYDEYAVANAGAPRALWMEIRCAPAWPA